MATKGRLEEKHREFIVDQLACYKTPQEVADLLAEEYGIDVDRSVVQYYDPTKIAAKNLARKWRDRFAATREGYLRNVAEVPIANRRYRLDVLQRQLEKAESMGKYGNIALVKDLLEMAAKEVGDVFTNRRKIESDPARTLAELLGVSPAELTGDEGQAA